jgi:hypothetical protein
VQNETLWGDITVLPELRRAHVAVRRQCDLQLKPPAQMDGWLRGGSAQHVDPRMREGSL